VGRGPSTRGLAAALGWRASVVDGDDDVLAAATLAAIGESDLDVVRSGSALAATSIGGPAGGRAARRDALSALDARVVAPLLGVLEEKEAFTFVVASDSTYDSRVLAVARGGVPCAVLRTGDRNEGPAKFTEAECSRSGYHLSAADVADLLRS